ncbi:MAG: membrane protein FxsA [Candidatus Schekmanbacteria bacterium]|nr:membrane protein FxsA [Candidatus Schekmanbacteria bacterium]
MFLKLLLLFTILPLVELSILIKVGGQIGALNTIALVLVTGIIGTLLAKTQGMALLRRVQNELGQGRLPAEELLNGVFILTGGVLLLAPGFLTDILGIIFLIPITRNLCKKWLRYKLMQKLESGQIHLRLWG